MAEYKFLEGPRAEIEEQIDSLVQEGWKVLSLAKERPSDSLLELNRYRLGAAVPRKERSDYSYVLLERPYNN